MKPAVLGLILLLWLASAEAEPTKTPEQVASEASGGEPEIKEWEILAPATSWEDGYGGDPPPYFEDPASVDCGDSKACWEALGAKTGEESCKDRKTCEEALAEDGGRA